MKHGIENEYLELIFDSEAAVEELNLNAESVNLTSFIKSTGDNRNKNRHIVSRFTHTIPTDNTAACDEVIGLHTQTYNHIHTRSVTRSSAVKRWLRMNRHLQFGQCQMFATDGKSATIVFDL